MVPDLARHLAAVLGLTYGEDIVPADSLPLGVVAELPKGAIAVQLDENQPAPEYGDGSAAPELNHVRVRLVQRTTDDYDDLDLLLARRVEVLDVLAPLSGVVGAVATLNGTIGA